MMTLGAAAGEARACKKDDGPTGTARVKVTFVGSGEVKSVILDPPFADTAVGACVAAAFQSARVPPFVGTPVSVKKTFHVP